VVDKSKTVGNILASQMSAWNLVPVVVQSAQEALQMLQCTISEGAGEDSKEDKQGDYDFQLALVDGKEDLELVHKIQDIVPVGVLCSTNKMATFAQFSLIKKPIRQNALINFLCQTLLHSRSRSTQTQLRTDTASLAEAGGLTTDIEMLGAIPTARDGNAGNAPQSDRQDLSDVAMNSRILIAEDNPMNQRVIKKMVQGSAPLSHSF
jgi:CheY-like chemotaxis protein